ncbi:MAG: peptidylprolyl isomerase [Nanoarchaeota archaeon]
MDGKTDEKTKHHDFIELNYTGKLADGTVFDTTIESVAKTSNLFSEKKSYQPAVICIGEKQILPGLDAELEGRETGKEYTVTLPPEKAFGKRDVKLVKIISASTFKEHQVEPHPGLQVNIDNEIGVITNISGGRIIVNFNHPLAGKEVTYVFTIVRKITDKNEQVASFVSSTLGLPKEKMKVEVKEDKAAITLPLELPLQISNILMQRLVEVTGLKDILFEKEKDKTEKAGHKTESIGGKSRF